MQLKEYLDYSVQSGNTINIKDELIDSMKSFFSSIDGYNEQKINDLRTDNSLEVEVLINYCRERLSTYKIPQRIIFVNELEITFTGKIKRS